MKKAVVDRSFPIRGGRIYEKYTMTVRRNVGSFDYVVVEAEDGLDLEKLNFGAHLSEHKGDEGEDIQGDRE